jgi:hypothetical protein
LQSLLSAFSYSKTTQAACHLSTTIAVGAALDDAVDELNAAYDRIAWNPAMGAKRSITGG